MKKMTIVCILLCLLACGRKEAVPQGNSAAEKGLEKSARETKVLSDDLKEPETMEFTAVSVDDIKEGFSKKEISKDSVFGFDPKEEILYQDISDPTLEAFKNIRITDLKTGEGHDVELERTYKYMDAEKVVDGTFYFIGSNTDAGADYVEVHPDGSVKRVALSDFDRIAAFAEKAGFYVSLEKVLGENKLENAMFFMEYGGEKADEILNAAFTLGKDEGVKEGHLYTNFYGMGNTVGFQELDDYSENVTDAKGSYLLDREKKILYEIPFITRLSRYLAGDPDLIVNLNAPNPEGEPEDDRCTLYKKEGEGYRPYVLPGYDYSNFIRESRILDDGRLFIDGDVSLDFVDLSDMRVKKISTRQENLHSVFFSNDGILSFVEEEGDKNYLYWGKVAE